ncbi:hypothetical protein KHA80_15360 [Anaerobacillus sp. HL2]|nr:hypothetical protein KHA80_15360 [Anaerobacillus sp. HL2]
MMTVILFTGLLLQVLSPLLFTFFTENIGHQMRQKRSSLSVEITELLFGYTDLTTNRQLSTKLNQINQFSGQLIYDQEKDGIVKAKGESLSLFAAFVTSWVTLLLELF